MSGEKLNGRGRVALVARCGCGAKFRRWRFADRDFGAEAAVNCSCGKPLVWGTSARRLPKTGRKAVCEICAKAFLQVGGGGAAKVCGVECRKEKVRRYQRERMRATRAAMPERPRKLSGWQVARKGVIERSISGGALKRAPKVAHAGEGPHIAELGGFVERDEPKSTNYLDTPEAEAAVRANPLNKCCPACKRAFYGAARFCGGQRCRRGELEGGARPWDGPQLRMDGRVGVRAAAV